MNVGVGVKDGVEVKDGVKVNSGVLVGIAAWVSAMDTAATVSVAEVAATIIATCVWMAAVATAGSGFVAFTAGRLDMLQARMEMIQTKTIITTDFFLNIRAPLFGICI